MPRPFKFRIRDEEGETPEIHGSFSDDEWGLLTRFAALVDEVGATPIVRRGLDYGFSFTWDAALGWLPVDVSRFPSKTELREFLHVLRPIILESEATFLLRVLKVLSRKAPHPIWKRLRSRFYCSRVLGLLRIEVNVPSSDRHAIVLNSERTLKKWLNAFEYHRDAGLAAEFAEIHASDFPTPEHTKGLMLELLREKTIAAAQLREVVRSFELGKGATCTVR